jgi:hypothetical protein
LILLLLAALVFTGCSSDGDPDPVPVPPAAFTTIPDSAVFNSTTLYRTAFGNGKFVITGATSTAWHSSDGITWEGASDVSGLTPRESATDNISGLNFVKDRFLATGGSNSNVARAFSSDGDIWHSTKLGAEKADSFNAKGVAYGGGKYLVSGSSGRIAHADALNAFAPWTVLDKDATTFTGSSSAGFINALAFGNGKFVAGGGNGHSAFSTDGTTWTEEQTEDGEERQTEAIFSFINDITYGGGNFVAVGEAGSKIAWSADGVNWTESPDCPEEGRLNAVAYGGGYFVAVGNGPYVVYSDNGGKTWTASATELTGNVMGVAYGNGKFVISGGSGEVAYAVVFE